MNEHGFWRDESYRFFERNFHGTDLRGMPPASYVVELLELFPLDLAGARILDVGCGAANNLHFLARQYRARRAVGLEASPDAVAALREAFPEHEFVTGDAASLPFEREAFDLVIVRGVLHWVDRSYLLHALGEALRVCAGYVLLSDFAPLKPYSVAYRHDRRHRTFKAALQPILEASGLVRELGGILHHDGDEWNCMRTTLYRKLPLDEAYPLRDESAIRRPIVAEELLHAERVNARAMSETAATSPRRRAGSPASAPGKHLQ